MTGVGEPHRRTSGDVAATPVAVELELRADRPLPAVYRLVAAGVAGRHSVTVDHIDDLQLALDAALRRRPAGEVISLRITSTADDIRYELGPLAVDGADRNALERVLSTLVEGATTNTVGRGAWVHLRIPRSGHDRG